MTQAEPNSPRHLSAYAPGYGDDDEGGLDLGQVLATLRRRALLIIGVTTVVSGAAVYKALTDTPIYTAGFEILTEPVTVETQVISAVNPETLSGQEEIVAVEVDAVKLKLLKSPTVIDPVLEELSNKYPGVTYGEIVSNLTIKSSADNLLTVSYQSPKREFTMDVLNQLEAAYLDYSLEARQADILKGIKFVNEQIPQLKARVDEQQLRLQELRQKYNLVDPDSKGTTLSTQVSSVEQQRLELDLQLNEARSLYAALQRELENAPTEVASSSILLESPRYQDLLTQLRTLDQQIAQESVLYLERSPELTI
ncbi:MAG: GumC family protein [Microcoleaceae cyanobacterium]